MKKGLHGKDGKTFENLDYQGQARSLNGSIQDLNKALNAHFRKGKAENKDIPASKSKYKDQLLKIIEFLNEQ